MVCQIVPHRGFRDVWAWVTQRLGGEAPRRRVCGRKGGAVSRKRLLRGGWWSLSWEQGRGGDRQPNGAESCGKGRRKGRTPGVCTLGIACQLLGRRIRSRSSGSPNDSAPSQHPLRVPRAEWPVLSDFCQKLPLSCDDVLHASTGSLNCRETENLHGFGVYIPHDRQSR